MRTICCFCVSNDEEIKGSIISFVILVKIIWLTILPNHKKVIFLTSLTLSIYIGYFFLDSTYYSKFLCSLIVTTRQLNIVMLTIQE